MSNGTVQSKLDGIAGVAELYRRYAPWLKARVRGRYGPDVDDIIQDAWLRVASIDRLEAVRHPKAFLLRVATNVALGQERHRRVIERHKLRQRPIDHVDADQLQILMFKQVILDLPQPLRDVFVLSRVTGLSNLQIAERLGISPKTVEWRMTRALALCAKQLRR